MVVSKGSIPLQALGYYIPFITSFINNMRKIEREMIQAIMELKDKRASFFYRNDSWSKANTLVKRGRNDVTDPSSEVYLHGNHIATYFDDGRLIINHQGWITNTTKSRLNALITFVLGGLYGIYQKNYQWYYRIPDGDDMPLGCVPEWFTC